MGLLWLVAGLVLGAFFTWLVWWHCRQEILRIDEEKQRLQDERTLVVQFMHELIETIGRGSDRDALMQRVVHSAVLATGAMSGCVFAREGRRLRAVAVEGLFPPHRRLPESVRKDLLSRTGFLTQILKSEVFEVGEGLVGMAARTGQGVLIQDAEEDPRVVTHDDPALRIRSCVVVPISFRGENLAVLALVNRIDGMPFGEADFSLANSLAEQAGLALQNLSLMALRIERNRLEADLVLASNIQGLLLPSAFPQLRGLDVAGLYEPAQQVGGDLYDVVAIDENRYAVAIADVSGKGIPASLVMAITQSNLGHFSRHSDSPKEALIALNEVLFSETRDQMFVTIILAFIDLEAETLTLVRAGHEVALLASRDTAGEVSIESLKPRGMAVGMVDNEIFGPTLEEELRPFRPGDVLLLYTDGITESANARGEEFGGTRLIRALREVSAGDAESINRGIRDRVRNFADDPSLLDDVTMLTVRRTELSRMKGEG